jgi:DNA-binding MarR family transcriptional regulator
MSKPFEEMSGLDRLLHEPARLAILTALSACRSCDFVYLQSLTALTKGNLSNHLQRLEQGGLIEIVKTFRGRVPQTVASLTPRGREAIDHHWARLEALRTEATAFGAAHQQPQQE